MKPTLDQFTAYQKIFDYFNSELFSDSLENCILNFSRKSNTHGFFAPHRWEGENNSSAHEISLNPDTLHREPKLVLSTLVHEMVHLWQEQHGKPPRRNYHDKEWSRKMEQIGLIPTDTGEPGGKKVGQSMTHYILEGGNFERAFKAMPKEYLLPFRAKSVFDFAALKGLVDPDGEGEGDGDGEPGEPTTTKKKSHKIKYTCINCNINVWGKSGLKLQCLDCEMELLEDFN